MATTKKAPAKVEPKKQKVVKISNENKPAVKFVSFTFGATIPTQPFGNVQPHITVEAASYEDAVAFAMPKIEALYAKYADNAPAFFGKITETEKIVTPEPSPKAQTPAETTTPSSESSAAPSAPSTSDAPKSDAVVKAEKMIRLALTDEAAQVIQDKIEKSLKIAPEDKPALITLVLKKRSSFKKPE